MANHPPSPEERRRAWSTVRIMSTVAAAALIFLFVVMIWRGCHNDTAEPDMLDPDQTLPGEVTVHIEPLQVLAG